MNVVELPRRDDGPSLIALAPQDYVRRDPYIGLTEAIAWVGSRDKRFSDAAYYYLHERGERRRDDTAPLWFLMNDDLWEHYGASLNDAEAEVMSAELIALGRFQGGPFEQMDGLLWVDVSLALDDMPDSIRPKDLRNNLGKPLWSHIRFKRADVLARWPEAGAESAGVPTADPEPLPVLPRAELQGWVREQIAGGVTLEAVEKSFRSAFADRRIKQNREDVREIYRAEFGASKGELRPGPRVIG